MTSHERAVEVDTRLADLWDQRFSLERTLGWKSDALHQALGERRERNARTWQEGRWPTSLDEAMEQAAEIAADAPDAYPSEYCAPVWQAMAVKKALAETRVAVDAIIANDEAQRPLSAEYYADPWPRFFLVQNTGGHIHSSMHCSTTFPTTQWGWLPSLSGLTEADAVAAEGTRLCSVCYPSAPVEWTVGLPPKVDPDRCPGSGQPATRTERAYQRRIRDNRTGEIKLLDAIAIDLTCPVCGRDATETRNGVRAHKAPKAKKGARS